MLSLSNRKNRWNFKTWLGVAFILPSVLFVTFSTFIPTIWNVILSFQEWDGFKNLKWVGLENYVEAAKDPQMLKGLFNSFYLGIFSTAGAVILGIALSLLIYKLGKWEGAVYRLIIFMPVMLPLAIVGLLFTFMYNPEMGPINRFLDLIGAGSLKKAWLADPATVMPAIAFVNLWKMAGLTMMLCSAAILSIPSSLFESSKLDGANYFKQIFYVILPLIKPIIQLSTIFTLIVSLKTYDLVYVMTKGGPGTVSKTIPIYMVENGFEFSKFGYSASIGIVFAIIAVIGILLVSRLLRGENYEY